MFFAKNMNKTIGKNISKNLSGKYSPEMLAHVAKVSDRARQKLLDHAKQYATDALKTTKQRGIQKNSKSNCSFYW